MNDNQDSGVQRPGRWAAFIAAAVLVIGLVSWQVHRSQGGADSAAVAPPAPADSGTSSPTVQVDALADELLDVPLTGDLAGVLYFAVGEAVLPADAAGEIEKVRAALEAAPKLKVVLSGFHDASGDAVKNAALARRRAEVARNALKAAGVDAARILLRKPEQTLADGSPQEARRVEMRLVE